MLLEFNMKRIITYTISLVLTLSWALAQSPSGQSIEELKTRQSELTATQDSLQNLLNSSRSSLSSASSESRDSLSTLIVKLEGDIFDIRAQLSRIGSELTDIEEQYAMELLSEASQNSVLKNIKIYETDKLEVRLSNSDLETLKNAHFVADNSAANIHGIKSMYDSILSIKAQYEESMSQPVLDSLKTEGESFSGMIRHLDREVGGDWKDTYDHILGLYLVMFDSAPNIDRSTLEEIENQSREVRRAETFIQQGSLAPYLAVFELQLGLLKSYEDAIAKALHLSGNYSIFDATPENLDLSGVQAVEFGERILTVYSPVTTSYKYTYSSPDEIPEVILPLSGVYYSIQVAILSKPAQSLTMFRETGPVQLSITSDKKYRYSIGGFHTYAEAEAGVAALKKAGFKVPTVVAWIDGASATIKEAKAWEEEAAQSGEKFKVIMTTESAESGETLRGVVEMHGKGKVVSRIVTDGIYTFTTTEFLSKEEAEVFAQILRDRASETTITVEEL